MSILRSTGVLAAGLIAAVLAVAALGGSARAQSPGTPRAATSCKGTINLTPSVTFAGLRREVQVYAAGLEPNAPFTIFVGGQAFVTGTTNSGGTTNDTVFFQVLGFGLYDVQVTTAGTCAAGVLTVAGPAFIVGPFFGPCINPFIGFVPCQFTPLLPLVSP